MYSLLKYKVRSLKELFWNVLVYMYRSIIITISSTITTTFTITTTAAPANTITTTTNLTAATTTTILQSKWLEDSYHIQ